MSTQIRRKTSATMGHNCPFPLADDELLQYIPDSCHCAKLRRWFRRKCIVSEKNPLTKALLKSNSRIREEKRRHLFYHYYMIHPFSEMRAMWEICMALIFVTQLLVIPIYTSTPKELRELLFPYKLVLDIFCVIDILLTFLTGNSEPKSGHIVLDPGLVAAMYLKCYFWVDLISSFPFEMVMETIYNKQVCYIQALCWIKIVRIGTLLRYMRRCASLYKINETYFQLIQLITLAIIIMTWATGLELFVYEVVLNMHLNSWLPPTNISIGIAYLRCWYRSVFQLSLSGYGVNKTFCHIETAFNTLLLIVGVILKLYITALIRMITQHTDSPNSKYIQMVQQLHEYIRYKELPESMKRRIMTYYDYRFQKRFYKEKEILTLISGQLKQDIVLHSCRRLVENVAFFKNLPAHVLVRIVSCLRSEVYLKDDVIVQHTTEGEAMYFIASGTVAIYTSTGKEICHLEDGAHFGEVAVIMDNERRIANVVALETCELYVLEKADFRLAIAPYPALYRQMKLMALQRIQKTIQMDAKCRKVFPTRAEMPRPSILSEISTILPSKNTK